MPCELNSRSFRLANDECAIGRAAKVFTGGWKVSRYARIRFPNSVDHEATCKNFQSGQVGSTPTWHSQTGCRL